MKRLSVVILLTVVAALGAAPASPRILVGANVLVDRQPTVAHMEDSVAVNPANKLNIIGASITVDRVNTRFIDKIYVSFDGGSTWRTHNLPNYDIYDSGDPEVAFGPDGTAYVFSLMRDFSTPRGLDEIQVYRSTDGGYTWSPPARMPEADYEKVAVDRTDSRYRASVYIFGPGFTRKEKRFHGHLILLHSRDGGRTFSPELVPTVGGSVNCKTFLDYIRIDYRVTRAYPAKWDGEMLEASLPADAFLHDDESEQSPSVRLFPSPPSPKRRTA